MRPKLLLRIAAFLLLFFALGHTVGHVTRHQVTDEKAKQVLQMMTDNKFDMFGSMRSYDENYEGMSLNLIFTLLALATAYLFFASSLEKNSGLIRKLLVPFSACIFGFAVTGFLYFFLAPALSCLLAFGASVWAWTKLPAES